MNNVSKRCVVSSVSKRVANSVCPVQVHQMGIITRIKVAYWPMPICPPCARMCVAFDTAYTKIRSNSSSSQFVFFIIVLVIIILRPRGKTSLAVRAITIRFIVRMTTAAQVNLSRPVYCVAGACANFQITVNLHWAIFKRCYNYYACLALRFR